MIIFILMHLIFRTEFILDSPKVLKAIMIQNGKSF